MPRAERVKEFCVTIRARNAAELREELQRVTELVHLLPEKVDAMKVGAAFVVGTSTQLARSE